MTYVVMSRFTVPGSMASLQSESDVMTLEYGDCSELNSVEVFNMDNLLDFIYFD